MLYAQPVAIDKATVAQYGISQIQRNLTQHIIFHVFSRKQLYERNQKKEMAKSVQPVLSFCNCKWYITNSDFSVFRLFLQKFSNFPFFLRHYFTLQFEYVTFERQTVFSEQPLDRRNRPGGLPFPDEGQPSGYTQRVSNTGSIE